MNNYEELGSPSIDPRIRRMLHARLSSIKSRCKCNPDYIGVSVCQAWLDYPTQFVHWAVVNGFKPGLTIDRIINAKGYTPENCRWVTMTENLQNKLWRQEKYIA